MITEKKLKYALLSEFSEVLLYLSSDCDSLHYARLSFLTNDNSDSPQFPTNHNQSRMIYDLVAYKARLIP